jgi:DNA ligase D-like protein (predicted ligase)
MLLLRTSDLPQGAAWLHELKFDGFRAIGFKSAEKAHLRSRNDNDFSARCPSITNSLSALPKETVIDGEIVALDEQGRPSFNALQNYGASTSPILYYIFDLMILKGKDVMQEPLLRRRQLLESEILPRLKEPIRYSPALQASVPDLIRSVKAQGLEGLVAKRLDSRYEPGRRSGAWQKMRVNQGQEFVIGGYTPSPKNFDALIFGYYQHGQLMYAARTRNGFTPSSREQLFTKFHGLEIKQCPFVNLPEKHAGRWGQGLTEAKMAECRWLRPLLVGQFEFVEWTPDAHLRHSRFLALRDDKKAKDVIRE